MKLTSATFVFLQDLVHPGLHGPMTTLEDYTVASPYDW